MENSILSSSQVPMGLGMALMQTPGAMEYFAGLSQAQKQQMVNHTHTISSKEEMQAYVSAMINGHRGY